jgi:hypothetical protein
VWQQKARSAAPRVLAIAAAVVFTIFAFLYSPTAFVATATQQGQGTQIRIWLLLAFAILAAVSTWMLVIGRQEQAIRAAINFSSGFNLVWIFSFIGPPVVLASVVAAGLATVPAARRQLPILIGAAVAGLCLGLLVLRIR